MTALPPQRSVMEVAQSGPTPPSASHHIQTPQATSSSNAPIDCYEDMFKEITRKLYGEEGLPDYQGAERALTSLVSADRTLTTIDYDAEGNAFKPEDHITAFGLAALMQNGFPPPGILNANFTQKLTTVPASTSNAEDKWTASEELLPWTTSRIASYNPAQKLFRCAECECVGFLGRVAEHWMGAHGSLRPFQCPQCPYASAWARCAKIHLTREHNVPDASADAVFKDNPVLDEVTRYLQRLKTKVETPGLVNRQIQPTNNTPTTSVAIANPPAVNNDSAESESVNAAIPAVVTKRYNCGFCPYATDRRDLYTRHENIHREEKPFQCYVCQKQFNRADHVKKHFLRMHREHPYDLNRIRKQTSSTKSPVYSYPKFGETGAQVGNFQNQPGTAAGSNQQTVQRTPKVENKQGTKNSPEKPGSKKKGEKRYACCYCSWAGVDNWCLKRHLNTHLKPFVCALCDYKAARSERLATHVLKVHNKKACSKCSFLAEDQAQLVIHQQEQHSIVANVRPNLNDQSHQQQQQQQQQQQWRPPKQGAERLFHYMEASDGSDPDDQQHYTTSRLQPMMQTISQDFHKAGGMQWMTTKYNNNNYNSGTYGISPGKRQRINSENKVGNKENISDAMMANPLLKSAAIVTQQYYEPQEKISKIFKTGDEIDRPLVKSPEVLNLKIKRDDELLPPCDIKTEDDINVTVSIDEVIDISKLHKVDNKRSRKQKQPCKVASKVTLTSIRDEFLTKHISRKSLVCSLCPKTDYAYHTKLSLELHMSLRHSSAITPCLYCGKEFEYDHIIKSHQKNCKDLNSAKTNNSASVSRPKITIDQKVPDF